LRRAIEEHLAMKHLICAIAALASACGSGKDESAAFVGTWPGAILDVGFADTIPRTAVITRSGSNELTISGLCAAPISASVQDAHTFTFDAVRGCLTGASSSCNSVQFSIDGGTGTLTLTGDLAIDMPGAVTSCGSLLGGVQAVFKSGHGPPPTAGLVTITAQPVASSKIPLGTRVSASGAAFLYSSVPLVDTRYAWSLTAPAGSAAALATPTSLTTAFTPDIPGDYTLHLDVTAVGFSGNASALWTVFDGGTVAALSAPQSALVGDTVALDASASTNPHHAQLFFTWTLMALPANSRALLVATPPAGAHFVPDLPGAYEVKVEVNDGFVTSVAEATINVTARL
jgi:hypothetical protein